MSENGRRYYVNSSSFLEPAELELCKSEKVALPPPTTVRKGFTVVMLEPAELELIPPGPPTALRVSLRFAAGADPAAIQKGIYTLLEALDDFERALGGRGLVVDASLSGGTDDTLAVVLKPVDVRWSLDRFTRLAEWLIVGPVSRTVEQRPVHLNGAHLAAVTALFAQRGPVDKQSARDRVQNWQPQQRWLADLQVEVFQPQ